MHVFFLKTQHFTIVYGTFSYYLYDWQLSCEVIYMIDTWSCEVIWYIFFSLFLLVIKTNIDNNHTDVSLFKPRPTRWWWWFLAFNNISVISWWSVLLVEETGVPREVTDKLYHTMLYQVHLSWAVFKHTTLVVIG